MGRELKRVALDFGWPISKVWEGYLNPYSKHSRDCEACGGTGSSKESKLLSDRWYGYAPFKPGDRGSLPLKPTDDHVLAFAKRNVERSPAYYGNGESTILREATRLSDMWNTQWCHHLNTADVRALMKAGRLHDFTHIWTQGEGWKPKDPPYTPTPEEVNKWSVQGFGHDSINQWIVVKAECKRLGVRNTCSRCNGHGSIWDSPRLKRKYDRWQQREPAKGPGYQMWETVSEGSPISPVFADPEDLAGWLSNNRQGTCDRDTTKEQWMAFILGPGWAPSFIGTASGLMSGVQAATELRNGSPAGQEVEG